MGGQRRPRIERQFRRMCHAAVVTTVALASGVLAPVVFIPTANAAAQPTLTVIANVVSRIDPNDQLEATYIADGGVREFSGTTGTQTTASPSNAGSVTQGNTYTIVDAILAGPSPMSWYSPSIICVDQYGVAVSATDTGTADAPSWSIAIPGALAYTCTVSNTPNPPNLTIAKQVSSDGTNWGPTANQVPGGKVYYRITATNTGTGDWTPTHPASITDRLGNGGVLDDATYNGDISATSGTAGTNGTMLTWSGTLAHGASVTITYSVTVNNPDTGNHLLDNAVSGPAQFTNLTKCTQCATETTVPDLTVSKQVSSDGTTWGSTANGIPGRKLYYLITVTNPGPGDWPASSPASVTDDMTNTLNGATYNNDAVVSSGSGLTYPYNGNPNQLHWSGALVHGASVTIKYSVTVNNPDTVNLTLTNGATAPYGNCVSGTGPNCSATGLVPNLVTHTSVSSTNSAPGSKVTYTITMQNTGPGAWTAADPASMSDNLSGVLDDATYNNDVSATGPLGTPTAGFSSSAISWSGPIPSGQTVTITFSVTIDNPDLGGNHQLDAVAVSNYGNCLNATMTTKGCGTDTTIPDMQTVKAESVPNPAPGSVVTYTIVVVNNGTGSWPDSNGTLATFTDNLNADVLDDATYNNDLSSNFGTASYSQGVINWASPASGSMPPGQSATITFSVTVSNPDLGNHVLANRVDTIAGNCLVSAPPDPSCSTRATIPDMQVTQTPSSGDSAPGTVVKYTISVTNSGTGSWPDSLGKVASFGDDLSRILSNATYNNDAAASVGTVVPPPAGSTVLKWTSPSGASSFQPGQTATITFSVTLDDPMVAGSDHLLRGTVVADAGNCLSGSTNAVCTAETKIPDMKVSNVVSNTNAAPGSTVAYTLTVVNNGTGAWPDSNGTNASMVEDLGGIQADATYNRDVAATAGAATVTGSTLTWSGPVPAGGTVTVTYTFTVDNPDRGSHFLRGTAAAPTGNCMVGSSDGSCSTLTTIPDMATGTTVTTVGGKSVTSAAPGSIVHYAVTVTNSGTGPWPDSNGTQAAFTESLANVLDDATYNGDVHASSGTATVAGSTLSWSSAPPGLAVNASVTVTYSVTVKSPDKGDHSLMSAAVAIAGNCLAGSTDPACSTSALVPDMLTSKMVSTASTKPGATSNSAPGSKVTYTITVGDNGLAAWPDSNGTSASFTDDLSKGVLPNASYDGDVKATIGTAAIKNGVLMWSGPLTPTSLGGAPAVITFSVTPNNPLLAASNHRLDNVVVAFTGNCIAGAKDPSCSAATAIPDLRTAITSKQVSGQVVDYTITTTNNGTGPWPDDNGTKASLTDSLSGVLGDATYNGDVAASGGKATVSGSTLSWSGAIPVGGTVTITYSVKVNSPDTGGHLLQQTVDALAGNCAPVIGIVADPSCSNQIPIPTVAITQNSLTGPAVVGTAYPATQLTATGGTGPYTFAVTTGLLPPGLNLSSSGVLSGTPTQGGNFPFTVTITDGNTATGPWLGTTKYTISVASPVVLVPGNGSAISSTVVPFGGSYSGPVAAFTRPGWSFEGWYTAALGGVAVTFPTTVTAPLTLYAQWTSVAANPTRVEQGAKVTVSGQGFWPGEHVRATLHSVALNLGTFTADSQGTVTLTATIPVAFAAGAHTITLTGTTSGRSVSAPLNIYSAPTRKHGGTHPSTQLPTIPDTGGPSAALLAEAALMLLVGFGLMFAGRRRVGERGAR